MKHSLDALARKAGIQKSYTDIWGRKIHVSAQTREAIIAALDIGEPPELPQIHIVMAGMACERIIHGQPVALPALPTGYHPWPTGKGIATVIAAPPRCWLPDELAGGERLWGVSAQLYGLRTEHNWGIGDFSDLAYLAEHTAGMGAGILGVNPLHASYPSAPELFSPYAPSNREFLNYLYIDVTRLPGCEAPATALQAARGASLVDYPAVAQLKKEALERCFAHFRQHADRAEFEAFLRERGEPLQAQATFDALSEHFRESAWYGEWPQAYRNSASAEVQSFRHGHAERVEFYSWLQYTADRQLADAQHRAQSSGMSLGLYRDLAVGAATQGAEIWQHPHRFVRGVAVGAPPDAYNRKGQNWGLPPFNPLVMQQEGMKPLIDLLRANMRHAGALRIDHAFGLSRLFWVPQGMEPTEGAYIHYPFEAMLAVLRVESHLNRCVVIGEDLGTFPPGYKEKAAASGILSYRLLYFEREADGDFIQPENYPALALAGIATHDLPTLAGWQEGWDIDTKKQLRLYPKQGMAKKDRTERKKDVARLHEALSKQNLEGTVHEAAQCYLARSPAMLLMMQLEDILGIREQANMPATMDEHPNWQRKLPVMLHDICNPDGALAGLAPKIRQERRLPSPAHPSATYRLQLHKGFTFHDAARIIPYLRALGISHIYTSPVSTARAGSTHGYDVTDHTRLNPELGGQKGYDKFHAALEESGIRHLLDVVPNHMGIDSANHWWQDVLAHGQRSHYAGYFDIDWRQKLLLPVLGKPYEDALAQNELQVLRGEDGRYWLTYYDHRFALAPQSCDQARQAMADSDALAALVDCQCYRLAHWREAAQHINYRRFFEINDLAGVRVEEPAVFESVHTLIFDLLDKGRLDALRIDHIDGLAGPEQYCRDLQRRTGPNRYIVVEKILGEDEALPDSWPIAGTTGYDALNRINGLFVNPAQEATFDRIHREFTGNTAFFAQVLHKAKTQVLRESFGAELHALTREAQRVLGEYAPEPLQEALAQVIAHFPVYRSYASDTGTSKQDARLIYASLDAADMDTSMRHALNHLFAAQDKGFLRRFQQLTGPVMAKGLEDTSFYRYPRFLSLNEVGGHPGTFGLTAGEFHRQTLDQQAHWPQSMIATSTHDTKRGEDMRARLNALTSIPQEWEDTVYDWHRHFPLPLDANDIYFLYQTLAGSWPPELLDSRLRPRLLENYRERLHAYMIKALREGKLRSSWLAPDETYEQAMRMAIDGLLDNEEFLRRFLPFARKLAGMGVYNSLAQVVLKLTLPGVPDIYQGTEYWDFNLVDPDNRRPVDYGARQKSLTASESWDRLLQNWRDGRVKQRLIAKLLQHRQQNRALYAQGEYIPLTVCGAQSNRLIAYARRHGSRSIIALVPRFPPDARMESEWRDTTVAIDTATATNILSGKTLEIKNSSLTAECLADFPVAILQT